jgi:hypothetical protein
MARVVRIVLVGLMLAAGGVALVPTDGQAQVSVEVAESVSYTDILGTLWVKGIIENRGTEPVGSPKVTVSLLDASGATVAAVEAHARPVILQPGGRAAWSAHVPKAPPFSDLRIEPRADPPSRIAAEVYYYDLAAEGVSAPPARGATLSPVLTGQVVNTGAKTAASVMVTAAVYGEDGTLHEVYLGFAEQKEIPPGQSSPFEVGHHDARTKPIGRYEFFLEGVGKP